MASSATTSLIQRSSAAVARQRWRWPRSSGSLGQRSVAASSISSDCSALDGWLAQNFRRSTYRAYLLSPSPGQTNTTPILAAATGGAPLTASLLREGPLHLPLGVAPFSTKSDGDEDRGVGDDGEDDGTGEADTKESEESTGTATQKTYSKKPSILEQLPQPYDPPTAYDFLVANHSDGSAISLRDFRLLCLSARPGKGRDANKIAQALRDFKRCNSLWVDSAGCRVAMDGMVSARTPLFRDGTADAEQKAAAILFALERGWLNSKFTGVYNALPTKGIDHWLEKLLECVRESEGRIRLPDGFDHTTDLWPKNTDGEDAVDDEEEDVITPLPIRLLRVVLRTVHLLIRRGSHPERKMKKRAARNYLKDLRMTAEEGNATPLSIHLAVQIALEIGGTSKCARDVGLTKFREKKNTDMEETRMLVIEKSREEWAVELAARAAAEEEAARAAAEAVAEAEAEKSAEAEGGEEDSSGDEDNAEEEEKKES